MTDTLRNTLDRELFDNLDAAHRAFTERLGRMRPEHWPLGTPCTEWTVRALVNHVVLGELSYLLLLDGGTATGFIELQQDDAVGDDPVAAYAVAARECTAAFHRDGVLDRPLDYPLGVVPGRQLLALRVTETLVHTWDLAVAVGAHTRLDPQLVDWAHRELPRTYAGVAESPVDPASHHTFFAAPHGPLAPSASAQDRLLHRTGRTP